MTKKDTIATGKDIENARKAAAEKILRPGRGKGINSFEFINPNDPVYSTAGFVGPMDAARDLRMYAQNVEQNPHNSRAVSDFFGHFYGDENAGETLYGSNPLKIAHVARRAREISDEKVAGYIINHYDAALTRIREADEKSGGKKNLLMQLALSSDHILSDRGSDKNQDKRVNFVRRVRKLSQIVNEEDPAKKMAAMREEVFADIRSGLSGLNEHDIEMIATYAGPHIQLHFNRITQREETALAEVMNYATCYDLVKRDFTYIHDAITNKYITADKVRDIKQKVLIPEAHAVAEALFSVEDPKNDANKERSSKKSRNKTFEKKNRKQRGMKF